ncbi:hypothetical protein AAMO2058_000670400 [Amorphochlora amoebiformis]
MKYSIAWVVSDSIKCLVALCLICWDIWKFSQKQSIADSLLRLRWGCLIVSIVYIPFILTSHEPLTVNWQLYNTFQTLITGSLLIMLLYVTLLVSNAQYRAAKLTSELPIFAPKIIFSGMILVTIIILVSWIGTLITNSFTWNSCRNFACSLTSAIGGGYYCVSLWRLRNHALAMAVRPPSSHPFFSKDFKKESDVQNKASTPIERGENKKKSPGTWQCTSPKSDCSDDSVRKSESISNTRLLSSQISRHKTKLAIRSPSSKIDTPKPPGDMKKLNIRSPRINSSKIGDSKALAVSTGSNNLKCSPNRVGVHSPLSSNRTSSPHSSIKSVKIRNKMSGILLYKALEIRLRRLCIYVFSLSVFGFSFFLGVGVFQLFLTKPVSAGWNSEKTRYTLFTDVGLWTGLAVIGYFTHFAYNQ